MYIDEDFAINRIQPNFLSLLLTGKFRRGVTERVRLKRIFTSGVYTGYSTVVYSIILTQVNRMSRSRRVLATGGKQRILRLDMVCIETILFHLDSF